MANKDTATAAQKALQKGNDLITGATVAPITLGNITTPAMTFKGDVPRVGSRITARIQDGKKYSGIVATADVADGTVTVTFKDGMKPA
jgi:hypothetical protein